MNFLAATVCAVTGLVAGSWFHVLARRTPMHQSLRRPGFHCSVCGTPAPGSLGNALIGQIKQRSCATCGTALWADRWLPVASALLLGFVGLRIGFAWALPAYLVFFSALLVITVVDLRLYLIPNRIVYPTLFSCLVLLFAAALIQGSFEKFGSALIGMAGAWLFYFIVWFAYPKGMGFGDVRLSAVIGLMAGWISLLCVAEAVVLGLALGAASGVLLMVLRFRTRKDAVPFGPFMAVGAGLAVLFYGAITRFWLGAP